MTVDSTHCEAHRNLDNIQCNFSSKTTLSNIINLQQENENNNLIECGKKIRIYVKDISSEIYNKLLMDFRNNKQVIVCSLLEHENKISVNKSVLNHIYFNYNKPIEGLKE